MTTPDTSAVRAWARENGYDVADRGRLPAEISDAYATAHRRGGATRTAPKKGPVAKKSAPQPAHQQAEQLEPPAAPAAASTEQGSPGPKPSPVTDDRRLVALAEELNALTERVKALESQLKGKNGKPEGGKTARFRRSK